MGPGKESTNDQNISLPRHRKKDTFFGDRSVVLSKKQLESARKNPKLSALYMSCIGFYPYAKNHFRKRKKGIKEHILIYCIDGNGVVSIDNNNYHLSPNTFFVIPANRAHAYWASQDTPWSIYWIHFGGVLSNHFKEMYGDIKTTEFLSNSRKNDRIKLFNEILTVLESGLTQSAIEFSNLYMNSLLASFYFPETYINAKGIKSTDPVDKTIFYMQRHINEQLSMSDFVKSSKVSASHLSKLFRNKTGSSPMDYFINLKMQEAIRLLSNQALRVKEVAYKLGYTDPFYFSRIFTKQIGSTPSSFLKNK